MKTGARFLIIEAEPYHIKASVIIFTGEMITYIVSGLITLNDSDPNSVKKKLMISKILKSPNPFTAFPNNGATQNAGKWVLKI